MIDHSDDGDYYTIKLYHSFGMNNSLISQLMCENAFKTYGYRYEASISDRYIFIKVYKNGKNAPSK